MIYLQFYYMLLAQNTTVISKPSIFLVRKNLKPHSIYEVKFNQYIPWLQTSKQIDYQSGKQYYL